jgi:hypothetical protein
MRQQWLHRRALAITIGCGLTGACGGTLPPPVFSDPWASPDRVVHAAPVPDRSSPAAGTLVSLAGVESRTVDLRLAAATALRPLSAR